MKVSATERTTMTQTMTWTSSAGTEAPAKKVKITLTAEEEKFAKQFQYQALAVSIKSFEERKDIKGKDTFALSDWWKSNCATLPGFTYVLRAVLTNSPNSCPSE
jgi:hypothetical protein